MTATKRLSTTAIKYIPGSGQRAAKARPHLPHPPAFPSGWKLPRPKPPLIQTIDTEGSATGPVDRAFPSGGDFPSNGFPLLGSFFFMWSSTQLVDHHLQQLMLLPDAPEKPNIELGYHDVDGEEYIYHLRHHVITDDRTIRGSHDLDISNTGRTTLHLFDSTPDYVFVLLGLQLTFRGTDHHINEIGVLENDGQVTLHFNDWNADDTFLWRLRWARVPRDLFSELGEATGVKAQGGDRAEIPSGPMVVRGFHFDFQPYFTSGGDHHIRSIGVFTYENGALDVYFEDKNGDDGFDWMVKWGILRH